MSQQWRTDVAFNFTYRNIVRPFSRCFSYSDANVDKYTRVGHFCWSARPLFRSTYFFISDQQIFCLKLVSQLCLGRRLLSLIRLRITSGLPCVWDLNDIFIQVLAKESKWELRVTLESLRKTKKNLKLICLDQDLNPGPSARQAKNLPKSQNSTYQVKLG